jgi:hypothetical protein
MRRVSVDCSRQHVICCGYGDDTKAMCNLGLYRHQSRMEHFDVHYDSLSLALLQLLQRIMSRWGTAPESLTKPSNLTLVTETNFVTSAAILSHVPILTLTCIVEAAAGSH